LPTEADISLATDPELPATNMTYCSGGNFAIEIFITPVSNCKNLFLFFIFIHFILLMFLLFEEHISVLLFVFNGR